MAVVETSDKLAMLQITMRKGGRILFWRTRKWFGLHLTANLHPEAPSPPRPWRWCPPHLHLSGADLPYKKNVASP